MSRADILIFGFLAPPLLALKCTITLMGILAILTPRKRLCSQNGRREGRKSMFS